MGTSRYLTSLAAVLTAASAVAACGTAARPSAAFGPLDTWGDPLITPAQQNKIEVGMPIKSAFGILGGKPAHPYVTSRESCYSYSVRRPDAPASRSDSLRWSICVKRGHVTGKHRVYAVDFGADY